MRIERNTGARNKNTIAINEGIQNENVVLTNNKKQGMGEARK
jgi:hypothetical protein